MLLTTAPTEHSDRDGRTSLPSPPPGSRASSDPEFGPVIDFATDLAQRYELSSLAPLLASCRSAVSQHEVSVAVVGRFKAGKSSFLNHFTNRSILPVGVVPVTAVVTEIRFGPREKAAVHFIDGRVEELPVESIGQYISERENPTNSKRVRLITVELPALERFRGLKFVDTPGLESALLHNTEEALKWLPNVGLALVAVSVDPPLSQQDITLLTQLYRYTPNVSVLLTKVDLLDSHQRGEVIAFVSQQLQKAFEKAPQVVPYSTRPGYEDLKDSLERTVFQPVLARFGQERGAIIRRKIDTLLRECSDYILLSLKSAELMDTERKGLKEQLIGRQQVVADVKSQLRLIAHHAAAGTRTFLERRFEAYQQPIVDRLLKDLAAEFPKWTRSLAVLLDSFDQWLGASLTDSLTAASENERSSLSASLQRTSNQVARILQDFRDRLSDGTMRVFGFPLRTTEVEIEVQEPEAPDVHVGKIFDRNWELLSPIVPVALIKGLVRRHFEGEVSYKVLINISRLVSQWEERINAALLSMEKEAERRLDELVATVGHLIETGGGDRLPAIREDLQKIESLRGEVGDTVGKCPQPSGSSPGQHAFFH
jgi:GTP-binding protein EngB required for normal cell division